MKKRYFRKCQIVDEYEGTIYATIIFRNPPRKTKEVKEIWDGMEYSYIKWMSPWRQNKIYVSLYGGCELHKIVDELYPYNGIKIMMRFKMDEDDLEWYLPNGSEIFDCYGNHLRDGKKTTIGTPEIVRNPFVEEYEDAAEGYKNGEIKKYALRFGNAYRRGQPLGGGKYLERDMAKAFEIFTAGAEAGCPMCAFELGCAYYYGKGEVDPPEPYDYGDIVDKDMEKSIFWFEKATEGDNPDSIAMEALERVRMGKDPLYYKLFEE